MSNAEEIKVNITSRSTHRGLERSTTLNRRYVKRPTKVLVTDGTETLNVSNKKEIYSSPAPKIEFHKVRNFSAQNQISGLSNPSKISHISKNFVRTSANSSLTQARFSPKPSTVKTVDLPPAPNPYQSAIDARRIQQRKTELSAISSRALKDAAINRALSEMDYYSNASIRKPARQFNEEKIAERVMRSEMIADKKANRSFKKSEKTVKHLKKHKAGRILLAFAASASCVIALAALIKLNLPNISVKVAAAQTGVEASYPNYIPRDFTIRDVYTNNQSVIIEFTGPDNKKFTLTEEKSSWDSTALLTNYVKGAYGDSYDTVREQGTTIYISHSNAAWVNNGIFYRLTANSGILNKKQITSIVSSL